MGTFFNTLAPAQLANISNFVDGLSLKSETTTFHLSLFEAALEAGKSPHDEFSSLFALYRTTSSVQGVARWILANPEISLQALNRIPRPLFATTGLEGLDRGLENFLPLSAREIGCAVMTASSHGLLCSHSDDPGDKSEKRGLAQVYRGQTPVPREKQFDELREVFASWRSPIEKRIEAIEDFELLTKATEVRTSIETLLQLFEGDRYYDDSEHQQNLKRRDRASSIFLVPSYDLLSFYDMDAKDHVETVLLHTHVLAAIVRLLKRLEIHDEVKREILSLVLDRIDLLPKNHGLVRLEKDLPEEDPYRAAPYLADLDRPMRVLLGEALSELTQRLKLDSESRKDQALQNRIDYGKAGLLRKEFFLQEQVAKSEPRPHQPSLLSKIYSRRPFRLLINSLSVIIIASSLVLALLANVILALPIPVFIVIFVYFTLPGTINRRLRRLAAHLEQYRSLYSKLHWQLTEQRQVRVNIQEKRLRFVPQDDKEEPGEEISEDERFKEEEDRRRRR